MTLKEGGLRGSLRNVGVGAIAIPDSVVDDFERGNLNPYSNTSGWEVTTSNVVEGSNALGLVGDDSAGFIYSLSGDGLNYYPQKGDVFSILMRAEEVSGNNSAPVVGFGSPDGDSGYAIAHWNFDTWKLYRYDDGSITELTDSGENISDSTWYEYEVEWHDGSGSETDGTIVVTQYEVDTSADLSEELGRGTEGATIQATDTTYNSRGIFYISESGNQDQITVSDRYWKLGTV